MELNEEVDPTLIIRRLKQEIRDLKEEVRMLKGEGDDRGPYTPDEIERLKQQVCRADERQFVLVNRDETRSGMYGVL